MAFCSKCGKAITAEEKFCSSCGAPANPAAAGPAPYAPPAPQAGTGMAKNVAGLLCYVVGWITGIIFLVIEKDRFVRFHAMQSILVFGGLQIIQIVLSVVLAPLMFTSLAMIGLLGLLNTVLWIAMLVLWILLMVKAYNNQMYKLPFVGDLAEKYSK